MRNEIVKIFIEKFGLDESIIETANIISDNYISSLDVVRLICEIENKFKIKITDNEIKEENFGNLNKIRSLLPKSLINKNLKSFNFFNIKY